MKNKNNLFYVFGVGLLTLGILLGFSVSQVLSEDDSYRQLRKLEEAYSYITRNYVEDVDTAKLSEDAIEGMLEGLDPHSVYIDARQMERVRESFNATFEGVGIYYEFLEGAKDNADTLAVLMPIAGGPSEEAGLLPGDRIIQVSDTTALGWDNEDVQKYLKGPKGTKVNVLVKRPGFRQPIPFTITRDKIPLNTVVATYMVDDETGYIKLGRFARTSHAEVLASIATPQGAGDAATHLRPPRQRGWADGRGRAHLGRVLG